jgi:hypothetical protein
MSLQDLGAIGEVVAAVAVVVSLIYVARQIHQSSRQLEQNSRHLEASMYHATNDAFYRWFSMLAQDETLASLWRRALAGEALAADETTRVNSLIAMLFLSYENNFQQLRLGAVKRDTLEIAKSDISALMSRPVVQAWWKRNAGRNLTAEFRAAIESLAEDSPVARDVAARSSS